MTFSTGYPCIAALDAASRLTSRNLCKQDSPLERRHLLQHERAKTRALLYRPFFPSIAPDDPPAATALFTSPYSPSGSSHLTGCAL